MDTNNKFLTTNGDSSTTNQDQQQQQSLIEIRSPTPGDWGWIMSIHGKVYAEEFGWNSYIELYAGQTVCDFMSKSISSPRNKAWIAALNGQPVGSILITEESQCLAKLRLYIVGPAGRGFGLGKKLLAEAIEFCKEQSFSKIEAYTQKELLTAKRIYEKAGFKVVHVAKHSTWGPELEGIMMELDL